MKKNSLFLLLIALLLFFSCEKATCEENNTGSIMIHNDGAFLPNTTIDFYIGSRKLTSLNKNTVSVVISDISVGQNTIVYKLASGDTLFVDTVAINQCNTLQYFTSMYEP